MNLTSAIRLALPAVLLAGGAWAQGGAPAKPAPAETPAAAKQDYDAIFSSILESLPKEKKALVDSARGAKMAQPVDQPPGDPEAAKEKAKEKRTKALESLPPEVKARVDKAIVDLDNRRKQRQAELKELDKNP